MLLTVTRQTRLLLHCPYILDSVTRNELTCTARLTVRLLRRDAWRHMSADGQPDLPPFPLMLFKSLFLILSHGFCPACPPEKVLVIDTGLARLNFAHLAHPLLLTRALGQRVLLDTQLLQHLAVVPHTVLALLFNLLLALNQQDQLVFIARLSSIKWGVRTG
eukprot:COSAG05_NODE_3578_length_1982_cov_173.457780_2_plen_162_part_00